ncbi:MAG: PD-(D/E)XK nuclease family protein [Coleofasciculus sp. C1-SOL-03]|jgi:hypothetical protein|uniref:PD-(D/E)XK nuclease family protein n=1 Tax=Coleofasciculus sp. C1-SOL-03 TaxID=3069522 RepID=UPI0032F7CE47
MNADQSTVSLTRLSQGQLNLLETCPRKFQHIYVDQFGSPVSPDQQERLTWGSDFHLLMQQRELGLPIDSLLKDNPQLNHWVTALMDAAPEVFARQSHTFREAEHCRTLTMQGYLLTVIYDLFIEDEKSAQILDWKTYPLPRNRHWLAKDWQTRLYRYVLLQTSDYLPEQISMTYWFVKSQPRPQCFTFPYDRVQHEKTRADLTELLTRLSGWLHRYQHDHIPFPQVPISAGKCDSCSFAVRCQRTGEREVGDGDLFPNLADIEEVSI